MCPLPLLRHTDIEAKFIWLAMLVGAGIHGDVGVVSMATAGTLVYITGVSGSQVVELGSKHKCEK